MSIYIFKYRFHILIYPGQSWRPKYHIRLYRSLGRGANIKQQNNPRAPVDTDAGLILGSRLTQCMMTSSNGNIFRVTGHLCGEFTGPLWIPRTKASDAELCVSLIYARINGWVNTGEAGDLRRHGAHYGVIVMERVARIVWTCFDTNEYTAHTYILNISPKQQNKVCANA